MSFERKVESNNYDQNYLVDKKLIATTCDLFLMKTPESGVYKKSDFAHLYLYKNEEENYFYQIENGLFFFKIEDDKYSRLIKDFIKFDGNEPNLFKCEEQWFCDIISEITTKRGHTLPFSNDSQFERIFLLSPDKILIQFYFDSFTQTYNNALFNYHTESTQWIRADFPQGKIVAVFPNKNVVIENDTKELESEYTILSPPNYTDYKTIIKDQTIFGQKNSMSPITFTNINSQAMYYIDFSVMNSFFIRVYDTDYLQTQSITEIDLSERNRFHGSNPAIQFLTSDLMMAAYKNGRVDIYKKNENTFTLIQEVDLQNILSSLSIKIMYNDTLKFSITPLIGHCFMFNIQENHPMVACYENEKITIKYSLPLLDAKHVIGCFSSEYGDKFITFNNCNINIWDVREGTHCAHYYYDNLKDYDFRQRDLERLYSNLVTDNAGVIRHRKNGYKVQLIQYTPEKIITQLTAEIKESLPSIPNGVTNIISRYVGDDVFFKPFKKHDHNPEQQDTDHKLIR